MKIPVVVVAVFLGGIFTLEAWTLSTLVDLKADNAGMKADIAAIKTQLQNNNQTTIARK